MPAARDTDFDYMTRCLSLARSAKSSGETAVGSIVVRDGAILGEGREATQAKLDPAAHAEVEAIREACRSVGSLDLSGCTLYTTVEPCLLCGYAIRATGVTRVVIGTSAGEVGAVGSRHAFLRDADFMRRSPPPEITSRVMEDEARRLLLEPKGTD